MKRRRTSSCPPTVLAVTLLLLSTAVSIHRLEAESLSEELSGALSWRNIGPDRGGRSIAVGGSSKRPHEYYFGATGGGLWKTADSGVTWKPVTDGQIKSSSVGAVAVSASNPDVVYIGMGEAQLRGNVMQGDGVYKSVDAGETWTHVGLSATRVIARIRVSRKDSDLVYVAALGDPTQPTDARGVYRSRDGGMRWEKVLFRGPTAGAVDLVLDPEDPNVVYASIWQVYRNPYRLWSGGAHSGLFKSVDGGDSWQSLSDNAGFARGVLGKIGVTVSPASSSRVYAVVEAAAGGLYLSDDGGSTWERVNASRDLWQRAFYFNRIEADPADPDTVYILNFRLFRSDDAGRTTHWVRTPHADHHDLWIDPGQPARMICATDGGGTISINGGASWSHQAYPTAQMYHVTTTNDVPYHVVGAQQDNTTAAVYSAPRHWRANPRTRGSASFYAVGGGENGFVAVHPLDPNVFLAGATNRLTRFDRRTGETRDVQPYPRVYMGESSTELPERWNWVYPIVISSTEPITLYAGSQHVWSSTNEGQTWRKISPDLTRADPRTMQPSGGPIVLDQDGPEVYATLSTIAVSPFEPNTLFAGSDDGLVHVTRDGGDRWLDVTPADMIRDTRVSLIEVSPHRPSGVFVAGKRNQMGDRKPYLWKSDDYGESWERIDNDLPEEDFVHAVREDPSRAGLLYAGTEHGIHVSFDGGTNWNPLNLNLPDVQIPDLTVKGKDLVIATHGRSFYILDDISPLRQWRQSGDDRPRLFDPSPASRQTDGANLDVFSPVADTATLRIHDPTGRLAAELTDLELEPGLNRFRWDLRYPVRPPSPVWSSRAPLPRGVRWRHLANTVSSSSLVVKRESGRCRPNSRS